MTPPNLPKYNDAKWDVVFARGAELGIVFVMHTGTGLETVVVERGPEAPQVEPDRARVALDRRAIERALKSHGEATVRAAIDGCSKSPWHKGKNDRGQVYDDVRRNLDDHCIAGS